MGLARRLVAVRRRAVLVVLEGDTSTLPPSTSKGSRERFAAVVTQTGRVIRVDDVMAILALDRKSAAKTLARWYAQRRLQRVGHGLYTAIPLDSRATGQVLEDPWILVPSLFDGAYIGGWTAAEHWDLTEQLFRDIFVFTTKAIRARKRDVHGITFLLRHIEPGALFGTRNIWRGQIKVQVSDVHRTIIWLAGGARAAAPQSYPLADGEEILRRPLGTLSGPGMVSSALEIIRFAGANRLTAEIDYVKENGEHTTREIEAYSLRRTRAGAILLHTHDLARNDHRSYRTDRIRAARATGRTFAPRHAIELTPGGVQAIPPATRTSRGGGFGGG
jgi:WYL domain